MTLKTPFRLTAGVALTIVLLVLGAGVVMRRSGPEKPPPAAVPAPPEVTNLFEHIVVRDFRLSQAEGGPFPFVALSEGRIAKPKVGGFRLGIGKMLELDRLELNLPLDARTVVTTADTPFGAADQSRTGDVQSVSAQLSRALDMQAMRRLANVTTPFTGLSISDLRISLVKGKERVAVITASSARFTGKAFTLNHCFFLTADLRQVEATKARLVDEQGWRIIGDRGQTAELEHVAAALRRLLP